MARATGVSAHRRKGSETPGRVRQLRCCQLAGGRQPESDWEQNKPRCLACRTRMQRRQKNKRVQLRNRDSGACAATTGGSFAARGAVGRPGRRCTHRCSNLMPSHACRPSGRRRPAGRSLGRDGLRHCRHWQAAGPRLGRRPRTASARNVSGPVSGGRQFVGVLGPTARWSHGALLAAPGLVREPPICFPRAWPGLGPPPRAGKSLIIIKALKGSGESGLGGGGGSGGGNIREYRARGDQKRADEGSTESAAAWPALSLALVQAGHSWRGLPQPANPSTRSGEGGESRVRNNVRGSSGLAAHTCAPPWPPAAPPWPPALCILVTLTM